MGGGLVIPGSGFLTGGVARRSVWSFLLLLWKRLGVAFSGPFFLEGIEAGLGSISCIILLFARPL